MRGDTPIMRTVIDIASVAQAGSGVDLRWTAVGESHLAESRAAGVEAARCARAHTDLKLLVVFAGHRHDLEALVDGVRRTADGADVVGCTTGGEIGIGVAFHVATGNRSQPGTGSANLQILRQGASGGGGSGERRSR